MKALEPACSQKYIICTHLAAANHIMLTKVYYLHATRGGVQTETGGGAKSLFWGRGCILIMNKNGGWWFEDPMEKKEYRIFNEVFQTMDIHA